MINSEFQAVFSNPIWRDKFYLALQNNYAIYPEKEFHTLIQYACQNYHTDPEIYAYIQKHLHTIKPFATKLRHTVPALKKQKQEISKQTMKLLGLKQGIFGYMEINSTGRYVNNLRKHIRITGPLFLVHEKEPGFSAADILEREQILKLGTHVPLNNYDEIPNKPVQAESLDVTTCFEGLHPIPLAKRDIFLRSIWRSLRYGGNFIVRDHDVHSPEMHTFVSLIHTVTNASLGKTWEENQKEARNFTAIDSLIPYMAQRGFKFSGQRVSLENDPSLNTLMEFIKI
jgi:hypothetical protein